MKKSLRKPKQIKYVLAASIGGRTHAWLHNSCDATGRELWSLAPRYAHRFPNAESARKLIPATPTGTKLNYKIIPVEGL